jgi:hypothetical protein
MPCRLRRLTGQWSPVCARVTQAYTWPEIVAAMKFMGRCRTPDVTGKGLKPDLGSDVLDI